jgi:hypothetical protein
MLTYPRKSQHIITETVDMDVVQFYLVLIAFIRKFTRNSTTRSKGVRSTKRFIEGYYYSQKGVIQATKNIPMPAGLTPNCPIGGDI